MKRVAIPVEKGRLSEYFGQCSHYEIFETDGVNILHNDLKVPPETKVKALPEWAAKQGITDAISYRVDPDIIELFSIHKINLFVGIPQSTPQKLMDDFLNGDLRSDGEIIREIMDKDE